MIFTAGQLQEKCQEQNLDLYMTSVDLTKAFDTVSLDGLWKIMAKFGCPPSRPAKSPDLSRRLSAFSLHCRLSGFEDHFIGEIENLLAFFFSDRLFYYLE